MAPRASIVIPTCNRPEYLEVALASLAPQADAEGAEVVVVDDAGDSARMRALAERFGARYVPHPRPLGLNAARNTGVERSEGELVIFTDDDVEVATGWLAALLDAARAHPEVQVFTGPIRPRLEGRPPRSCGREGPPITSLDLGAQDRQDAPYAWGANMALRRTALERNGGFDVSLAGAGDEQEWQERLRAREDGRVMYVARAALAHRRAPADATLRALCRAAWARGRASRRFDARRTEAPPLHGELRTLAACAGHVVRRRCPAGLTMVAHSAGRLYEGARRRLQAGRAGGGPAPVVAAPPDPPHEPLQEPGAGEDFLSGHSGTVGGIDGVRRAAGDLAHEG
ncbi:MAG: glycosyltransferase family 2 protein, partial [Solirubrobacterales bacterium]|nr:glycosyltransferase family 2 protein [Solirubrobacterales bacterium]